MRETAEMITMTQAIGALLLIILTMLAIPAINQFKYVENAVKTVPQAKRAVNPSAPDF
jgi:ABC-type phosphate/phosphonate transport system permease subunit